MLECGAHPRLERVVLLRDGEQGLHEPRLLAGIVVGDVDRHPEVQAELVGRIQTDVGSALTDLDEHRLVRRSRHERRGVCARGDHPAPGRHEGELGGAEHLEGVVEPFGRVRLAQIGELHREQLDLLEALAHVAVERIAGELEGTFEGLLDAHVEPVVDAAMQELDRKEVDQHDRGDRDQAEDGHHSNRQPGARAVFPDLAREMDEVSHEQGREDREARHREDDERSVELPETGRIARDVAQHEERQEEERDEGRDPPAAPLRRRGPARRHGLGRRCAHCPAFVTHA